MACGVALKRVHDFDDCLLNETDGVKRTRTSVHCSPFRAPIGTIAASLPSSSSSSSPRGVLPSNKEQDENDASLPFAEISGRCQLSSPQLQSYLKAEIRYLKRRKLIPRRALHSDAISSTTTQSDSSSSHHDHNAQPRSYRSPGSPTNHSASDSDGESIGTPAMVNKPAVPSSSDMDITERAMFSLRQVQMICERLLKEQELRLRYEYETVLNKRLEEQHEQYVQFAREQIQRRVDETTDLSYLS